MTLNSYASVAKGLKLKVRMCWGSIPTFVEVTGEKLIGETTSFSQSSEIHIHLHNMKIQKCEFKFAVRSWFLFHCDLEHSKNHIPSFIKDVNQFPANVPFLYLLKVTNVFMRYRSGKLAGHGLRKTYTHNNIVTSKLSLSQGLKQILPG